MLARGGGESARAKRGGWERVVKDGRWLCRLANDVRGLLCAGPPPSSLGVAPLVGPWERAVFPKPCTLTCIKTGRTLLRSRSSSGRDENDARSNTAFGSTPNSAQHKWL